MIWLIWYESYQFNHFFEKKVWIEHESEFCSQSIPEQILSDFTQITVKEVLRLQFQMFEKTNREDFKLQESEKIWLIFMTHHLVKDRDPFPVSF